MTRTPTGPRGPTVNFFGVTRADDTLVDSTEMTAEGVPIFNRSTGTGFSLVVEGKPAPGASVGLSAYDPDLLSLPNLQIEVSRPLGNGSSDVCDRFATNSGGVPAIDPPSFDSTQTTINTVNDLACRFLDGSGSSGGRSNGEACVLFPSGEFHFAKAGTTVQFCGYIDRPLEFPPGDTFVTVRLSDDAGTPGAAAQIVIRVGP